MTKFIIVAGGVISGVGKGVTTASLGKIVKEHGYRATLVKIDPYINFDAGTLRPTEHGEVWVTEDGGEIDQDLGTYERFMNQDIPKCNNLTTGQVYKAVIDRERRGEYLGQTVQFVPHIVDEIIDHIKKAAEGYEIVIIEVGGTVGDYENVPFLCALKTLEREIGSEHVAYVLVTYLPIPTHIQEMKTKPTQQAIRLLGQEGILPDFIVCRSSQPLDSVRKKKIEHVAHIPADRIISAPDIQSIYQMPLDLEREGFGEKILAHFKLESRQQPDWTQWQQWVDTIINPSKKVRIAIIGKYFETGDFSLTDSYLSIYQALTHAGAQTGVGVEIKWINSALFETNPQSLKELELYDGIIIPGGFGTSGVEGKIAVIQYARMNNIPYLGLCYGLQLAVIEFARNVVGLKDANTTEIDPQTPYPVIDVLPNQKELLSAQAYGGTMRLGAYGAQVKRDSKICKMYHNHAAQTACNSETEESVCERHRHRYEVNPLFVDDLEKQGLLFSGFHVRNDETRLMEFLELPQHPFFIATQAHPEFKSRLGNASPLFIGFVQAAAQKHDIHPAVMHQAQTQELR